MCWAPKWIPAAWSFSDRPVLMKIFPLSKPIPKGMDEFALGSKECSFEASPGCPPLRPLEGYIAARQLPYPFRSPWHQEGTNFEVGPPRSHQADVGPNQCRSGVSTAAPQLSHVLLGQCENAAGQKAGERFPKQRERERERECRPASVCRH